MFYISEVLGDRKTYYVSTPPGWSMVNGKLTRDPPGYRKGGPGFERDFSKRYLFKSHRSAARVANMCHGATIHEETR